MKHNVIPSMDWKADPGLGWAEGEVVKLKAKRWVKN